MFTVQPTFSIRFTPRDYRGPFSRMSIRTITFDNADKPILSLCRRSKIGFFPTEKIVAARGIKILIHNQCMLNDQMQE